MTLNTILLLRCWTKGMVFLIDYKLLIGRIQVVSSSQAWKCYGFQKIHKFVLKCGTFSKSTKWKEITGTPETLCVLVSKLPGCFRDRWNRTVQGIRRSYGSESCLVDLYGFVNGKTVLVNDPIFSREAVQWYVVNIRRKSLISLKQ